MLLQVTRIEQRKNSTLSEIYIEDRFFCYGLEDTVRHPTTLSRSPAIHAGSYKLGLKVYGAMHARYKRRFQQMHQGMLHILGTPDLKYAYIHIGNDFADSAGNLLVGDTYVKDALGDYELKKSKKAYKRLYERIRDRVTSGEVRMVIKDIETGDPINDATI